MKICTYNVRDLFLAREGDAKPARAVAQLARVIGRLDADVLLLQEVGSRASLDALNRRLAQPYPYTGLEPGNSNRSIHLGVLSRAPMVLKSHRGVRLSADDGAPFEFFRCAEDAAAGRTSAMGLHRDLLLVEVDAGNKQPVALFGVHLKSQTNSAWQMHPADAMRQAECRAVHQFVSAYQGRFPKRVILLAGDFNDRLSSPALAPIAALGFGDPQGAELGRTGRNPSTYWPKRRMRIDAILVSPNAVDRVCEPTIHVSAMARDASDHYPVSIRLTSPPVTDPG